MICPIHKFCTNQYCFHRKEHDHSVFGCDREGKTKCTLWHGCERKKICNGHRSCISSFEYEMREALKNAVV